MDETGPYEELLQRHKEEKKELQSQITKLKHSVSKGDKKGKKAVQEKITQLERELKEKHDAELKEAEGVPQKEAVTRVSNAVDNLSLETTEGEITSQNLEPKRMSKAQKRRNKKEEAARQRQEEIAQQEIQNESGARNVEFMKLRDMLKQRGQQIYEIPSDGNCLYSAVAHQINQDRRQADYKQLRQQAAKYMRDNADDFLPFLTTESGDPFTPSDFDKYCQDLEETTIWGGHLEIKALSHVLNQPIVVVQSDGPVLTVGEGCHGDPVTVVYHRHAFGLGEHYNSVEPLQESTDS